MRIPERIPKTLLAGALLTLLVGCSSGSYRILVGDINSSGNSISGSYKKFTGYTYTKKKLQKGDKVVLQFHSTSENDGSVTARLLDGDGDTVVEMDKPSRQVVIGDSGTYKFRVDGKGHSGSFNFSWDIKGS